MDAAITNVGTEQVFIPGPNIEIDAGETKNWNDIRVTDLDANDVIKSGVVAGTLTVALTPDANDAAQFDSSAGQISSVVSPFLPVYTVATLPTGVNGRMAFASDGRAGVEGAAAGTGTMVVYSNGEWRRVEDLAVVAA